jgi:1-deoxy-D-xylulose-5-phosphate synthase
MINWKTPFKKIEIGTGRKIKEGKEVAILSLGHPGNLVIKAIELLEKENISPAHYDLRFAKPLDEKLLHEVCLRYKNIITVEDGTVVGGVGSAVLEFMADNGYQAQVKRLGIPDNFIEHGEQNELYEECGFSPNAIAAAVIELLSSQSSTKVS